MLDQLRLTLVVLFAMVIGAAAALYPMLAGDALYGMGYFLAVMALGAWLWSLVHFARGLDRENPSELASGVAQATGLSLTAVGCGFMPSESSEVLTIGLVVASSGLVLSVASLWLKLRGITRKYENRRKARAAEHALS